MKASRVTKTEALAELAFPEQTLPNNGSHVATYVYTIRTQMDGRLVGVCDTNDPDVLYFLEQKGQQIRKQVRINRVFGSYDSLRATAEQIGFHKRSNGKYYDVTVILDEKQLEQL